MLSIDNRNPTLVDRYLPPLGPDGRSFSDIFRKNFYITTSGNFSTSSLVCSVME
jgi:hypothetical protein